MGKRATFVRPTLRTVVFAAALVAALVAAALWYRAQTRACEAWQQRYRETREETAGGIFDFVNQGPLAQLRRDRPDDCPVPE